jgi:hypothetical protein
MKTRFKNASIGDIINFSCFVVSVALGIIAFFLPPKGQIDNSVLMFIAEVGVFSTISRVPDFIKSVRENHTNLEIKKGDTIIKLEGGDEEENK